MEMSHPPKNANILKRSVITAAVTAAVASSVAIAQEENGAPREYGVQIGYNF